ILKEDILTINSINDRILYFLNIFKVSTGFNIERFASGLNTSSRNISQLTLNAVHDHIQGNSHLRHFIHLQLDPYLLFRQTVYLNVFQLRQSFELILKAVSMKFQIVL